MPSAMLPASHEGCAVAYLMREAVRNRETVGNGGKLVGSGRVNGIVSGRWSDRQEGLVVDKCSHWKINKSVNYMLIKIALDK